VAAPGPARTLAGRLLHFLGRRAHAPFLVVACGMLSPDLLADERDAGSTSRSRQPSPRRVLLMERARGGTLCLDGIEHLTALQQERLLQSLSADGAAHDRSGPHTNGANGSSNPAADVRLVATISEAPAQAVDAGRLSADLLRRFVVVDLRDGALGETDASAAPAEPAQPTAAAPTPAEAPAANGAPSVTLPVGSKLADMEKAFILATLDHCHGDKRRSAAMLGVSLRTLYNRLHDWKIVDAWTRRDGSPSDRAA
jgi:DNA-binding NtrC family response regulator